MFQDLRFTFRLLLKDRWYTLVAVIALALGIGVNATGFTIVNAAFLRGPVFKDSHQLYMLSWQPRRGRMPNISNAELEDWRAGSHAFAGIAAFRQSTLNISDDRTIPEQIEGAFLTANGFGVLGQSPLIGRDFASGEDLDSAPPVALLGYRLWQNRYAGDPNVLGSSMRINGRAATIIGVMPDKMNFPINAELWLPFIPTADQNRRDSRPLSAFGRLREGATFREAQAELNGIAQRLAAAYPAINQNIAGVRIETFIERFVGGPARIVFVAMMGAASFVLLIACANVANLLLSRSTQRAREIAVRIALGASRWRVLRQLLLESVVLAVIGGAAGLLLTFAAVRALDAAVTDPGKPYWIVFTMDYIVLGYAAAISVLTGILFGLAPALQVSQTNLNDVMKQAGRGTTGSRRARWFSSTMVVAELALTIVLLVGAGLMIRSFLKLNSLDVGFPTDHLMAMRLQLPASKYSTPEARGAFFDLLEPRLSAIPGVEAIAVSTMVPPFGSESRPLEIDGRPLQAPGEQAANVATVTISPGFFEVLSLPLRRGRDFASTDGAAGSETVIINEKMAAMYFPGEDPLGKRLRFPARAGEPAAEWRTIVGVSPSILRNSPQEAGPAPVVYIPYRQESPAAASLLIRSPLAAASVMAAARREVRTIDPDQPVFTIETMDQVLDQYRWPFRVFGSVFAVFAAIALVLSSVGLYAVIAYAVSQRTQELGVRIALGAQGRDVAWLILKRGLAQVGIGLAVGLAGAFALSRMLQGALAQVTPTDPLTFVAISILLTVVAVSACLIPARRATRVDPISALRGD